MPRSACAFKSASRSSRRNQSEPHYCCHNNSCCNAGTTTTTTHHHATRALSSFCIPYSSSSCCSSSASQSHCAGLPVSSLPSCSASVEQPSASMAQPIIPVLPLVPKSSSSSSVSSSSSSSSSSSCGSSSSSPNSSVSCSQQTLQDTLYEYVKGLQDAVKVPDPELAERLLVEIGNALSLPSAVSLIISANGARLIASCVKHFRSTGTLKPLKVASKTGRSSTHKEEFLGGGQLETSQAQEEEGNREEDLGFLDSTIAAPMDDEPAPAVSNECRRKRQRTVGDVEEDEELFTTFQCGESRISVSEKSRKPVRLKGRSLKVSSSSSSRKLEGISDRKVDDKNAEANRVGNSKTWAKDSSFTVEDPGVSDVTVKVFEFEEKWVEGDCKVEDAVGVSVEDEGEGSVYSLAKSSGMSNVVATACSALDKLLTAALQAKAGYKSKVGNASLVIGNAKRGKALSAEMYVALTEAFVDMVHVLKDNVELLSWCLNCLGSILPPGCLDRASFESTNLSSVFPPKEAGSNDDDARGADAKQPVAVQSTTTEQTLLDQKLFPSKALLKLATKYRDHSTSDFTLKVGSKSSSGSYVAAARSLSTGKTNKGMLQSAFCGGIASESTSSSISALAAVAYAATVPMLAEKAVKAVLSAMQSCDFESRSTMAALRALSAHLSSTNSKSTCDDAFAFVISAMREFLADADMQAESCLALGSVIRAVSSTTSHAAWTAITISMDRHRDNLVVQRAGCGSLQVLCTRTGLGVPEWRTGKRPLRASKDADREGGARALISSMTSFPNDVRIQWHGCSTLWTLVHSAGVKGVANMVKYGAVSAVVGAMSVCRMNEMMQQEGCNVIGTMVRTLAENGHDIGLFLSALGKTDYEQDVDEKAAVVDGSDTIDWWGALVAVVTAMKTFSKSKSLQSNGTFALGCILKGSGETANFGSTVADVPSLSNAEKKQTTTVADARHSGTVDSSKTETEAGSSQFPGSEIVDNIEKISAAVEATMIAMKEFPKVETVQVWGCAVLQQAFLAYVYYVKCLGPVSEAFASATNLQLRMLSQNILPGFDETVLTSFKGSLPVANNSTPFQLPSPAESLAKFILAQATSAMYLISRTMAMSYSNVPSGTPTNQTKLPATPPVRGKPTLCSRSQTTTPSLFFSSVRQSWCAALGAIGDVFGYLTRNSEVPIGKGGLVNSDCIDFFRSNKSFFDRSSSADQSLPVDTKSCYEDDRSESEDGAQSEKSSLDTGRDSHEESEKVRCSDSHKCSGSSWIDWTGFGASTQQAVKDIKAWQEATESMAKVAEDVGFPLSVKNAILSIRTIFYRLEDAETVIWACHALVSLYLTWENLHLFKPGTEVDREEYKAKIWGEGEAGVRQLVDLVIHWTNQNRLDVTSLALQALYGACVFAATVQEIEKVFALGSCGSEAVLGAMQKALLSGSAQHRRKVVQQACCVLATVCGYSIRAQVAVAVHGGADLILTALDRYNEDNQIQVNGLHALGIDSHAQPAFDAIWNSAISKTVPAGKSARRRRQTSTSIVGLTHIFREGVNCPGFRDTLSAEEASACLKGKWNTCFERLVLQGAAPVGLFRTALLAAPCCGGPSFAMELLRRLAEVPSTTAELQAHVCFVIGYMAEHNAALRTSFIDAGAMEIVLDCMSAVCSWKRTFFTAFGLLRDGVEVEIQAEADDCSLMEGDGALNGMDLRIQCAAAWAVAGLAKNQTIAVNCTTRSIVQALAVALHRYGGLMSMPPYGLRSKKLQLEVCVPARLALARLGVFRIVTTSQTVFLVHEAAETGDMLCLKALVESGVDVLVADWDGKNGEWHAELFGQTQAAQFLEQQGRKKAREKAKAKNKPSNRKKEDVVKQAQEQVSAPVATAACETEITVPEKTECMPASESISTMAADADLTVEEEDKAKGSQRASRNSKKKSQKASKTQNVVEQSGVSGQQKQETLDRLKAALREAMVSGEVEKMESALKACEEEGQLVDDRLLKQVKGAVAKRLKRREKASVLEDELDAAIEEASYGRLQAAVLAVEQSSRFATALQEKLQVGRSMLAEMDSEEATNKLQEQQCTEEKSELIEHEILLEEDSEAWIGVFQKSRRRKDKENLEVAPETTQAQDIRPKKAGRTRKQRNSGRQLSNGFPPGNNNVHAAVSPVVQSYPDSAGPRATLAAGHDLPPLLPTPTPRPSAHITSSSSSSTVQARSVIMPPKSAQAQASTSCEHNPITPQLFPSNRSPLVCNTDFSDYNEAAGVSQLSLLLSSSWSSPRSCSSVDDSRWGTWPASRSSTPVDDRCVSNSYNNNNSFNNSYGAFESSHHQFGWSESPSGPSGDYIAALLATLFPVERLPSSSTTLFSASLGEFPAPSAAQCAAPPPSGLSTAASLLHGGSGPDDSDILSFLDSSLSGENKSGIDLRSASYGGGSLFSEDNPCRMMTSSIAHDQDQNPQQQEAEVAMVAKGGLSLQSRLQAALIEASLEDCCCICFDMPKDAALVPCGHRMCKSCAEQIRGIRENCPICNRYIDAVLALYG